MFTCEVETVNSSDSSSGGSAAPLQCREMDRHTPVLHTAAQGCTQLHTAAPGSIGKHSRSSSIKELPLSLLCPHQSFVGDQECGSDLCFCSRGGGGLFSWS